MDLLDKIKVIYPELSDKDFHPFGGTIAIFNDSDDKGDYISKWEHPTLARPTEAQLNEVK